MQTRLQNSLKSLILVGLALFLANSIFNGTLLFYINRRFAWLTWIAALLLSFMAFVNQQRRKAGHAHHDPAHAGENTWATLALAALPLLLGLLVPPQPLGAQAVGVREINTDGVGLGGDDAVLSLAATERNILDWLRAFNAADDVSAFAGQPVRVIGFVFRDNTYPADRFMVSRFVVSCCVADASAVGLVVSWPASAALPLDAWVEVQGVLQPDPSAAAPALLIAAESVTPTAVPERPYLYP